MKSISIVLAMISAAIRLYAAVFTAGLEFAEGTPQGSIVVQCIDTNSALLGQWTVPAYGTVLTNYISATSTETNAHVVVAGRPYDSASLLVDGVSLATCYGSDVTVAPSMRIGTVDVTSGIADIDLRLMRMAIASWQPLKYGAFTNEYAGFTGLVACVSATRATAAGSSFVTVDAGALESDELDGAVVCAFVDANGDGRWTAGELFGCSKLYATNSCLMACPGIALTRTSPSMARYDLSPFLSGSVAVTTDRGVNGYITPNVHTNGVTDMPHLTYLRLRVVRDGFNEDNANVDDEGYYREVVLDRTFNAVHRPLFTEADLLAQGSLDLDWGTVFNAFSSSRIGSTSKIDLKSATYRVFVGDELILWPSGDTNILEVKFVNAFEHQAYQTRTTPLTPYGTINSTCPTFTWRHDNTIGKAYPAFKLRVCLAGSTNIVFDSGPLRAPPRNSRGVYSWTAPTEWIFSNNTNYSWSVSMLDAKFTDFRTRGGGEDSLVFMIAP